MNGKTLHTWTAGGPAKTCGDDVEPMPNGSVLVPAAGFMPPHG
jgi:hypothetical protein